MKKKTVKRKQIDEGKQEVGAVESRRVAAQLVKDTKDGDQLIVAYAKKGTSTIEMVVHGSDEFLMAVQRKIIQNVNPLVALTSVLDRINDMKLSEEKPKQKK